MLLKTSYAVARIVAAVIMLQTLYFKFTGSPESVYIFSTVGMEPWGRWLVGIVELIAAIFLVIPKAVWLGGIMAVGTMLGAIAMHLTILGIEVMNDGGYLFVLAVIVFICSFFVVVVNKQKITKEILPKFLKRV